VARLFVAVWPPPSLVARLRELDRPVRPGLRWTTEDQWHITVRFLGSVDADTQDRLQVLLGSVTAQLEPVEASTGPGPRALGRTVWVLPVEGLGTLAARVASVTRQVGEPPPERPFRGHITLARARRPAALGGLDTLAGGQIGERWRVTEITLVQSDLRPQGARYQVVGRWALGAG
jgi:2'-5' RNA ligase